MTGYDSKPVTVAHIRRVTELVREVADDLLRRGLLHDASKLRSPEKEIFDEFTPLLERLEYDSREYHDARAAMGVGLKHHYEANDHHPEHHENGVADMDLAQVVEMLCDWKASTERVKDGDLARSIERNAERFGYGDELKRLLLNTAERFGWLAGAA